MKELDHAQLDLHWDHVLQAIQNVMWTFLQFDAISKNMLYSSRILYRKYKDQD